MRPSPPDLQIQHHRFVRPWARGTEHSISRGVPDEGRQLKTGALIRRQFRLLARAGGALVGD